MFHLLKVLTTCSIIVSLGAFSYAQEYDDYDDYDDYGEPPEFQNASQHLSAKEGDTVIIPCQPSNETSYVLQVRKTAVGSKEDKLIFVGDEKILKKKKRYTFKDGQMEISNLMRSDAGNFTCSLGNPPRLEVTHTLNVQYAPSITAITQGEQRIYKGGNVTLECEAIGNPMPNIKWSRQDGRLPSGVMEEEGLNLTLVEVDRHTEGNYVCTADNGIGDSASDVVSVVVEYPPEIITDADMIRIRDNDFVELSCNVHARPAPTFNWTKDGTPISIDSQLEEQVNGGYRNSINISRVSDADFGEYICTAENKFGNVESSGSITVPKITAINQNKQPVHKGDNVTLECEAMGSPMPVIKWSRKEGHLPSGAMEQEGLNITLVKVDRHMEGTYVCTADNGIGDPVSDVVSVGVQYSPEIFTENNTAQVNSVDTVELICIVHARPRPTIEWTRDGNPIANDSILNEQENGGYRNAINISLNSDACNGEYICTAENKFGVVNSTKFNLEKSCNTGSTAPSSVTPSSLYLMNFVCIFAILKISTLF